MEPYVQLGWRLGSFILFSELEIAAGWNSIVFYEPDARDDLLLSLCSEMRLVLTWDNHALEFRTINGAGFYDTQDAGTDQLGRTANACGPASRSVKRAHSCVVWRAWATAASGRTRLPSQTSAPSWSTRTSPGG